MSASIVRAAAALAFIGLLGLLTTPAPALAQTPTSAPVAAVPRVRLVATGGTISNRTGGRLSAEELVKSMPGIERYAQPEFEQFSNVASSELTLDQWVALARRLNEIVKTEPDIAGLVVTSGTDTLEELAYFLDLTVRTDKPVVVVGSMRNPSTLGYEGAANLLDGFRVAASADARDKGVLVVLNDEINAAREVTKTDALRLNTFQSRGYGVLGVVDADRVAFFRASLKRHTANSEFDIASVMKLPDASYIEKNHFSNLKQADLSPTEKKVMIGLVDFPDATDKSLASHLGKSRHTVSKSRMWLEEEGLVVKKRLPNLLKLGFKVMAFSHISFNPGKPLDDKLLASDIIKNQSVMFLAARKFECVRLSIYMNYEDYRADYTRMVQSLKENNYLAEMPITAKYMIPSMVVMKDMVFGPIVKKTLVAK